MFQYIKEKNKFTWQNSDIKLVFENPSITAHDDHNLIDSTNQIMYFYYTVKIYKKITTDWNDETDEEIRKWRLVAERSTYDFPSILELKWILEELPKTDATKTGQKNEYRSGKINYALTYETEGFACDDFYSITRNVNEKNEDQNYIVYMGVTFDTQGDRNSVGIRTPYVKKEEIEELSKMVNAFIETAIKKHNNAIIESNNLSRELYYVKNNKLYEYKTIYDKNHTYIDKSQIDSIYILKDECWGITMLIDDGIKYEVQEIHDGKIASITNDEIAIESLHLNAYGETTITRIPLKNLISLYTEIDDDKLYFGPNEITDDFLNILDNEEKEEFLLKSEEELFHKYGEAIINRTAMCRSEHAFPIIIPMEEPDSHIKNAQEIVKIVIKNIKKKL